MSAEMSGVTGDGDEQSTVQCPKKLCFTTVHPSSLKSGRFRAAPSVYRQAVKWADFPVWR